MTARLSTRASLTAASIAIAVGTIFTATAGTALAAPETESETTVNCGYAERYNAGDVEMSQRWGEFDEYEQQMVPRNLGCK